MSAHCEKHAGWPGKPGSFFYVDSPVETPDNCHDCNVAQMLADDTTRREAAEGSPMLKDTAAPSDVKLAEVDRDREITCALIDVAGSIICHHDNEDTVSRESVVEAKAFLSAWFKRKSPTLQMPAGFDRPL